MISDKSKLFAAVNTECHHLRVEPDSDEYLQVWVKEPTWLQVEQALSTVMDIDSSNNSFGLDLNKMYRFMVKKLKKKTEPSLTALELLRLSPYLGAQLKDVLPNPFTDMMGDDTGNES